MYHNSHSLRSNKEMQDLHHQQYHLNLKALMKDFVTATPEASKLLTQKPYISCPEPLNPKP